MKPFIQFPVLLMLAFISPTLLVGCSVLKPKPSEAMKPSEPVKPSEAMKPSEPVKPSEAMKPSEPVKPKLSEPVKPKPSESETKKLVRAQIKEEVNAHYEFWGLDIAPNIVINGKSMEERALYININIKEISIEEWASYNETRKYWPVRVRVKGSISGSGVYRVPSSVQGHGSSSQSRLTSFNKVVECEFSQDNDGEWKVLLKYKD